MKNVLKICLSVLVYLVFNQDVSCQGSLDSEYKSQTVKTLSKMIADHYVLADVGKKTGDHLESLLSKGHFDDLMDNEAFAAALTDAVQSVNHDKHMRIMLNSPFVEEEATFERMIEEKIHNEERSRRYNGGFKKLDVLEGNVGYVDLRGFARFRGNKEVADAYMKLISNTDAVIIDMRYNGGGDPEMVQYLCSYFFDDKRHLNSLYFREGDRTMEFWTKDVDGLKMADVPLYVMTSAKTFSGAEEFSYNMQTQKRATLVGSTTGGGANPGQSRNINDELFVFIPGGMAINPITKTNWEGVGVVPEIQLPSEEAFDTTYQMALAAAEQYRADQKNKLYDGLKGLYDQVENYNGDKESIITTIEKCVNDGLLQEWEVNGMGYEYLGAKNKPKVALAILEANVSLFPESANAYDSFAEALMANGKQELSIKNYKKAVEVAKESEAPDIEMYKENLERALSTLKKKLD